MSAIRDQRHMYALGGAAPENVRPEEVERHWQTLVDEMLTKRGFRFPERRDGLDWQTSDEILRPYINVGRWVADCPACNSGIALWRDNPKAACLDCGTFYTRIDWPSASAHRAVEEALSKVTIAELRNWYPWVEKPQEVVGRVKIAPHPKADPIAAKLGLSEELVSKILREADR